MAPAADLFLRREPGHLIGLRGHGTPTFRRVPTRPRQLLQDLEAALEALHVPERIVLVGHSFGTALAAEFASAHPGAVEALILVAAAGEYRLAWNLRYALKLPTPLLDLIYPLFRHYLKAPPTVLKAMHGESVARWNGWSLFRDLQVPALVIQGHGDRVFGLEDLQGVARAIPGAEELDVGASGHMVMLERHEAVNRAISRFLGEAASWRGEEASARRRPGGRLAPAHAPMAGALRRRRTAHHRPPRRPPSPVSDLFGAPLPCRGLPCFLRGHASSTRAWIGAAIAWHTPSTGLGLGKGSRVMLLLPNLPQSVICFFGILKAGATVVFASPGLRAGGAPAPDP